MSARQTAAAKLYHTKRPDTPFLVVYRDPLRREKSGRAKRVTKWFGPAKLKDAERYRDELNERLLIEGAAGVAFDGLVRADAIAARRHLDMRGHLSVSLLHVAQRYTEQVVSGSSESLRIQEQLEHFLIEREQVDGVRPRTIGNLRTRCEAWIEREKLVRIGEITRDTAEKLRGRGGVGAQTRRNDMNAVSSFCSWLVEKRRLDQNPFLKLRRPKIHRATPAVWTVEELARLLAFGRVWREGHCLASLAVLNFVGARPSELTATRLFYGRHPVARIEGGKLRGRANRTVPLLPVALAWLKLAGAPVTVTDVHRYDRKQIKARTGLRWVGDICRHTFISSQLALVEDDARVARAAGTSEDIIHRHYHSLRSKAEARAWAALRPARVTAPSSGPALPSLDAGGIHSSRLHPSASTGTVAAPSPGPH
jgi:hypothetical protein